MTNALTTVPAQLPAYLQKFHEKTKGINDGAIGGIKAQSWPRINIGGSKFSLVKDGEKTLITDPANPQLPKMQLELIVIGHNPAVSKLYYEGEWQEGDSEEPDCSSDDGVRPDSHIVQPQSSACATCPQNQWGSKINQQGKQIKACSDNKRLVVIPVHDLQSEAIEFSVKPSALKAWAEYVRGLTGRGIDISTCVTLVYFDPAANYPKVLFRFGRFLTEDELNVVVARMDGDDVKMIATPRRNTGPVIPIATAPAAPAVAPPPQAAPAPPAPVDPYEGQPPHVKAAVEASGGLTSPAGKAVYKSLTGKDYVEQTPAPATPAPEPVAPPAPIDPYEGQPPHVKAAVEASGGLTSPAGKAVYKSLTGKDVPGTEAAPKKRGRRPAEAAQPAAPAPVPATTPAPAPAPTAPTFASAPEQTATPGNLGASIDDLLAKALATPT